MDASFPGLSPAASAALPGNTASAAKPALGKMDATATADAKAANPAVRKAAEDFESQFMSQMLTQMWQGIETDGYFGGGNGEEMFRGLLLNEYGKKMTQAGGTGIADTVQKAMLKMQEV